MKLAYAFLADAAQVTPDGKFSVSGGGVEILTAPGFPVLTPSLSLLIRLIVEQDELGRAHELRLELLDPDNHNLLPLDAESTFAPQLHPRTFVDMSLSYMFVVNIPGFVFPSAGRYVFRVLIDSAPVGEVPLHLALSPTGEQPTTEAHPTEEIEA